MIFTHMSENHWTVPLALIKFSKNLKFLIQIFLNILTLIIQQSYN